MWESVARSNQSLKRFHPARQARARARRIARFSEHFVRAYRRRLWRRLMGILLPIVRGGALSSTGAPVEDVDVTGAP
jgi:hypothetical protein